VLQVKPIEQKSPAGQGSRRAEKDRFISTQSGEGICLIQHGHKAVLLRLNRRFPGDNGERFNRRAAGETKLTAGALTRTKGIFVKLARLAKSISSMDT